MKKTMNVKVTSKNGNYEATVTLPGLKPTKLTKSDGTSSFATSSAVNQAVNSLAKRYGVKVESGKKSASCGKSRAVKTQTASVTTPAL